MLLLIKNFKLKIKNYLEMIRAMPDKQKKIVLWAIIAVLALVLGFLWFKTSILRLEKIEESVKNINIPSIDYNIEENKPR